MLALGIDPGMAMTGYALLEETGDGLRLADSGVIETAAGVWPGARLQQIYHGVAQLADRYRPHAAAVEEVFFSRNVRTALAVGQARGVVLLALADAGVPVYEYKPTEVKEAVTGYGAADKRQVQVMVGMLLGLEQPLRPDDAADAAAVAMCHLQYSRLIRAAQNGASVR